MQKSMTKKFINISLIITFTILTNICFATNQPKRPIIEPKAPQINANAYLLVDFKSDTVLAQKNANNKLQPASLTKMMTMYVINKEIKSGKLKLDDKVIISKKAWKAEGSRMFLEVNQQVNVEDLIKGIIIQSGNDACIALAEHIAGSEKGFAELMNYYAQLLNMKNSNFVNSTGLPNNDQYTTANDLAILAKATIKEFPKTYSLYSSKSFTFNNIKQLNRNRLLWTNDWIDGIKTGHTKSAGYCMVASGVKNNMRLIAVTLGNNSEESRADNTERLISWGFRFYTSHKIYSKGDSLEKTKVWMGKKDTLDLGLADDLYVLVVQEQYENLKGVIQVAKVIKAPINENQELGNFIVKIGDKVVAQKPLIALENIDKGGIFGRSYDYLKLKTKKLFSKIFS